VRPAGGKAAESGLVAVTGKVAGEARSSDGFGGLLATAPPAGPSIESVSQRVPR
jgi:hypothetical protein